TAEFPLVERRHVVWVYKFHRIFQRDDVDGLGVVDLVQNRGEGGGFAGTGGARDQDEAGFFPWDLLDDFRKSQPFQRRNFSVQFAANYRVIAALRKDADAE